MTHLLRLVTALMLLAAPVPAFAQANTKIEATATLKDVPPPPLELKPHRMMSFGTVTIPLKLTGDPYCQYRLRIHPQTGTNASLSAYMADGTGATLAGVGCAFEGTQSTGQALIGCEGGRGVTMQFTYASTAPPGVIFTSGAGQTAGIAMPALGAPVNEQSLLTLTGRIGCNPAPDGTELLLLVGTLDVHHNADLPRGSQINVGTITIDASY